MSTLTIHALDATVEKRIRSKARRDGRSINQTLKDLLAASTGVKPLPDAGHHEDFAEFCGIWTEKDAREFRDATVDFETGAVLVTYDSHFDRVDGLRLWDRPPG